MQRSQDRKAGDRVQTKVIHLVRPVADVGAGESQGVVAARAKIELECPGAEQRGIERPELRMVGHGIRAEIVEVVEPVAEIGGSERQAEVPAVTERSRAARSRHGFQIRDRRGGAGTGLDHGEVVGRALAMDEIEIDRAVTEIGVGRGQRPVETRREFAANIRVRSGCAGAGYVGIERQGVAARRNDIGGDGVELVGPPAERKVLRHVMEPGQTAADDPPGNEGDRAGCRGNGDGRHVVSPGLGADEADEGREAHEC